MSFGPDDQPISVPLVSGILVPEDDSDDEAPNFVEDTGELLLRASAISMHIFDRLTELHNLPEGWLDGEGERVSEDVVAYVRHLLRNLQDRVLSEVRVYPTIEGGLRLEWQRYSTEFSLEFQSDRTALYDEIDLDTGNGTERSLSFDEFKDVRVLLGGG